MEGKQEVLAIIKNKDTSNERLNNLLNSVNSKLQMSEKALRLLNQSENYTYDLHQEVLRIGSGGKVGIVTRQEFELLLVTGKVESLRSNTKTNLETAVSTFQEFKNEISTELSNRQTKKTKWRLWK